MSYSFKLDRTLTQYSHFPAEQKAYEAMQNVGFKIAELLMQKPRGTMSADVMGHAYWVSPVNGAMDVFCTPDYENLNARANVYPLSGFEGQGASDLDEVRAGMEEWLENPEFIEREADLLDALANGTAEEI